MSFILNFYKSSIGKKWIVALTGVVLIAYVIGHMLHRVLVDTWEAEKAVEEAHKKVVEIYGRYPEG